MHGPISFDDWKRSARFRPSGGLEVAADVHQPARPESRAPHGGDAARRSGTSPSTSATTPGPKERTQDGDGRGDRHRPRRRAPRRLRGHGVVADARRQRRPAVHEVLHLRARRRAARLGQPRQRGEKFMPGACVACHGGSHVQRPLPRERATRRRYLGARFLPFDTGNYLFSIAGRARRGGAERGVLPAQPAGGRDGRRRFAAPTSALVEGWYAPSRTASTRRTCRRRGRLATPSRPRRERRAFYRERRGTSLPHVPHRARRRISTGTRSSFDPPTRACDACLRRHAPTSPLNASMPNALASAEPTARPGCAPMPGSPASMARSSAAAPGAGSRLPAALTAADTDRRHAMPSTRSPLRASRGWPWRSPQRAAHAGRVPVRRRPRSAAAATPAATPSTAPRRRRHRRRATPMAAASPRGCAAGAGRRSGAGDTAAARRAGAGASSRTRSPAPASSCSRRRRRQLGNEPRLLVIDPLIDANTGGQTVSTVQMGSSSSRSCKTRHSGWAVHAADAQHAGRPSRCC